MISTVDNIFFFISLSRAQIYLINNRVEGNSIYVFDLNQQLREIITMQHLPIISLCFKVFVTFAIILRHGNH